MKLKKGKMNLNIKLFNLASAVADVSIITMAWNKRLKWNRKDKIGWMEMGFGTFGLICTIKKIADDNFIPEKQQEDTAPSMKEASKNNEE